MIEEKEENLLLRDVVLGISHFEHLCQIVYGSIMRGADVSSICIRVLVQEDVGVAEVIQMDELNLLQD